MLRYARCCGLWTPWGGERSMFPCVCPQGGLTLARALEILLQVVAGLMHLHTLGIIHRDLRAANILIVSLDPVNVVVADFGVSHLLSAFTDPGRASEVNASAVSSVLTGNAALGPLQVCRL